MPGIPAYRDYDQLPLAPASSIAGLDIGDNFRLAKTPHTAELHRADALRHQLNAVMGSQESIYPRNWKVHVSLVDVHKKALKSPAEKEQATTVIETAWNLIIPILKRYNVSAKVVLSTVIGDDEWPDRVQSKKNIVLYFSKTDDTPDKWHAMLTEIEKELQAAGLPYVDNLPGSRPIKGSRYMYFSSSARGNDMERIEEGPITWLTVRLKI